jgi:hypothetical protein
MKQVKYIGAVDLSARLSSMNPLGYVSLRDASLKFQREILSSCLYVISNSKNREVLLKNGIVKHGSIEKRFEFEDFSDFCSFVQRLRWSLLMKSLPFKICAQVATHGGQSLEDRWSKILAENVELDKATKDRVAQEFGTTDRTEILELFKLYRAEAVDSVSAALNSDLENFKGLGFYAGEDFRQNISSSERDMFFDNHFPKRTGRSYTPHKYVDILYDFPDDDLITRQSGSEDILPGGSISLVNEIFELLRRSAKAQEENGVFYISILNAFVISSNFDKISYIEREISQKPTKVNLLAIAKDIPPPPDPQEDSPDLSAGWQWYPPIFKAIALDPSKISILKRTAGFEIVVASMLNKICDKVIKNRPDVSENDGDFSISGTDPVLKAVVLKIQASYGEKMIRSVLNLPDTVIGAVEKRMTLGAATDLD